MRLSQHWLQGVLGGNAAQSPSPRIGAKLLEAYLNIIYLRFLIRNYLFLIETLRDYSFPARAGFRAISGGKVASLSALERMHHTD